jgi:hypothetical protein
MQTVTLQIMQTYPGKEFDRAEILRLWPESNGQRPEAHQINGALSHLCKQGKIRRLDGKMSGRYYYPKKALLEHEAIKDTEPSPVDSDMMKALLASLDRIQATLEQILKVWTEV